MTEEIIIDKEDKAKKHRNNEIDCLHFCCRKGESGNVLFWCDFYDDHCDNYSGCYYRKHLRLEQENKELKEKYAHVLELAKTNADSNEYCLQELEKECEHLRSALGEINILAKNYCNACDEFKAKTYKNKNDCLYCNYGFIKRKINEVLK